MQADRRTRLGVVGERLAAEHLERRGFTILERNFRTRFGELDIVAYDGSTVVFCEVKTRHSPAPGRNALESVRFRKQAQIRRMARSWLLARPDRPTARNLRFDAIGVTFDAAGRLTALEHLENAF